MLETLTVALFIIGNLIGAGFFMMPITFAPLGISMIWSWSVGAIIALTFSLIFGRLYYFFPNSEVLSDYFEDFALKQTVAVLYWIGAIVGNVLLLSMILVPLKFNSFNLVVFVGFCVILLITVINHALSYEAVAFIESVLSVLKFSLLVFLPLCVFFSNPKPLSLPQPELDFLKIIKLGALSFWAFLGIETAGVFGKGKSATNGLLIGILACFVLYVFSCLLIVGSVPMEFLNPDKGVIPLVVLIQNSKFAYLQKYISLLISFTCFGTLYGWVAATSKMSLSYAKTKLFSSVFLEETKSGNSIIGLWSSSIVTFLFFVFVSFFNVSEQFNMIADFCVNITLFIFCLCAGSLFSRSNSFYDKFLSLFGLFFVGFLLCMSWQSSLISLGFLIGSLIFSKLFVNFR